MFISLKVLFFILTNNFQIYEEKKYFDQLELYKKAIEYAYNKNVSRIYIYSTYLNELIDINL